MPYELEEIIVQNSMFHSYNSLEHRVSALKEQMKTEDFIYDVQIMISYEKLFEYNYGVEWFNTYESWKNDSR